MADDDTAQDRAALLSYYQDTQPVRPQLVATVWCVRLSARTVQAGSQRAHRLIRAARAGVRHR